MNFPPYLYKPLRCLLETYMFVGVCPKTPRDAIYVNIYTEEAQGVKDMLTRASIKNN